MVALGNVERKQNSPSRAAVLRSKGQNSLGVVLSVRKVPRATPVKRKVSPAAMMGSTLGIFGKIVGVVRLPSMLKRMSWPKTHTPPMMLSTAWRTWLSATWAKKVPVTMTSSSGWNMEPEVNPIGTTGRPAVPAPMPKAMRATASTMRKASSGVPVKTCFPSKVSRVLRVTSQPLADPSMAPAQTVAMIRIMFPRTSRPMFTEGWFAGAERPTRMPKRVSA
mmetsp:Transcript_3828/g.11258  ORF Transcript_3828/g.11258 Transcript_3828/m.11258 type:complete len:221 (+) Transcript_3828:647-1309(+)